MLPAPADITGPSLSGSCLRALVCSEDSQVLGGLDLAGVSLELGVLPSPGCSGGPWGLYACGFLLSGMLRAQGLIGSRWQVWQMLLSWWLTVVWPGQDWYPKDMPEVIHIAHLKLREVLAGGRLECTEYSQGQVSGYKKGHPRERDRVESGLLVSSFCSFGFLKTGLLV